MENDASNKTKWTNDGKKDSGGSFGILTPADTYLLQKPKKLARLEDKKNNLLS
jgi:hypothetical protein